MSGTLKLEVKIDGKVVQELVGSITGIDLVVVHKRQAEQAGEMTRTYLTAVSNGRHATAQRLGAAPTGFWGRAAESVNWQASASEAVVGVSGPGVGRAFHDVDILPGPGKKYLTIPVHGAAYGVRARELARRIPLVLLGSGKGAKKARVIGMEVDGRKQVIAMYVMVPKVHQKQDRTLMPSDEAYYAAGLAGLRDYVEEELSK